MTSMLLQIAPFEFNNETNGSNGAVAQRLGRIEVMQQNDSSTKMEDNNSLSTAVQQFQARNRSTENANQALLGTSN